MSLSEWHLMSEIVASFAVIVSLVFIACELRRNSMHSKQQAIEILALQRSNFLEALYKETELSSLIWRGFSTAPPLAAHDWARFSLFLYNTFVIFELSHRKYLANTIDQTSWDAVLEGIHWWIAMPGVRAWWKSDRPGYTKAFSDFISKEMELVKEDKNMPGVIASSFAGAMPIID